MSNIIYAHLNSDNICTSVTEYHQALNTVPSDYVVIPSLDNSLIGRTWDGSAWAAVVAPSAETTAREWRDNELDITDRFVPTTDHPQHASYVTYREALRAWPSTGDFPATKPVLG